MVHSTDERGVTGHFGQKLKMHIWCLLLYILDSVTIPVIEIYFFMQKFDNMWGKNLFLAVTKAFFNTLCVIIFLAFLSGFFTCFLFHMASVTKRNCLEKVPTIYPFIIDLYEGIMGLQQVLNKVFKLKIFCFISVPQVATLTSQSRKT